MQTDDQIAPIAGLSQVKASRKPPIHLWHPPFCGDIDMRIAADGTWYYQGGPITRQPMVELFASILRKDGERYVLVTPVEMVGIRVEDAPFVVTSMQAVSEGGQQRLSLRTNVGDEVVVGSAHPLRFERQESGGFKPYVMVRDDLWAKLTRTLYVDLVSLGSVHEVNGEEMFGVCSDGAFFAMAHAEELDGGEGTDA